MALDKYHLNLAGEYRAAGELLKRGLFATITYGNAKGADIYAIGSNRRAAVVEVKASNGRNFVTGFYQKYRDEMQAHPDFWVLYHLGADLSEAFHVLSHAEMAREQGERNAPGQQLSYAEHVALVPKGVDNVLFAQVSKYRDAWEKVIRFCTD